MTTTRRMMAADPQRMGTRQRVPGSSGRGRTVFVIEDSEVIRRVLALILEAEGYRVIESAEGSSVAVTARRERPDLVTLDLSLPDVDGRDLLRAFRADPALRGIPVVVLSAFADTLSMAERRQAADVIVKPFDLEDLLERLDKAAGCTANSRPGTEH